jgi:hypothetical protein
MQRRTSHVEKRTQAEVDFHLAAHAGHAGSLAVVAVGSLARSDARVWLGSSLIRELQVARRAGQRFGLIE